MGRITRDSFSKTLGAGDAPGIDVGALDKKTEAALEKAGIDQDALREVAGKDGVISGKGELDRLFKLIDRNDHDGSTRSFDSAVGGEIFEALKGEVERARLGRGDGTSKPAAAVKAEPPPSPASPAVKNRPSDAQLAKAQATLKAQGFTDVHITPGTPYFNQADKDWARHAYPKNPPQKGVDRFLQDAGCAPTALAMADVALRGSGTQPDQVADFAVAGRYSGSPKSHGSDAHGLGKAWAKAKGLTYTPARGDDRSKNLDTLRDGLAKGGVAVISVGVDQKTGKGHFTEKGHVMVLNGYAKDKNGDEWFFVMNPGRRDQETGKVLRTDANVVQDTKLHHGAAQLRISRRQLEAEMKHGFVLGRPAPHQVAVDSRP